MNAGKLILSVGIGLFGVWAKPAAQNTASATLSQPEILIGDQVTLRLNLGLAAGEGIAAIHTDALKSVEKIELLNSSKLDTIALTPKLLLEQRFTLTAFDSGAYRLPPLVIVTQQGDTVFTEALNLAVKTIPVTEKAELQPIKDIIRERFNWRDLAPYALAVLLVVGLALWLVKLRQKPKTGVALPPTPTQSPYERARARLATLAPQNPEAPETLKAYYSELNYLFREYLEGQFQLPALESTSREIEKALSNHNAWANWHEPLSAWLRRADLIKFAKAGPQTSTVADFTLISNFIDFAQALVDKEEADQRSDLQGAGQEEIHSAQPHSGEIHSDEHE